MNIVFIIGILVLNIIIHELAHALAMIKHGIAIEEISIGIKVGFIPHFVKKCEVVLKNGKKLCFNLILSPFLLGAYVKPVNGKEIDELSYKQKASIFGAGVIANLILGFIFLIPFMIVGQLAAVGAINITKIVLVFSLSIVSTGLLLKWSRQFSMIIPILGVASLAFIGWSFIKFGAGKTLVSPIGIIAIASSATSIFEALLLGVAISFGIGMTNMLPIFPFDGGLIFLSLLEKWFGKKKWLDIFKVIGIGLLLLLITVAIASDIVNFQSLKTFFRSIKK